MMLHNEFVGVPADAATQNNLQSTSSEKVHNAKMNVYPLVLGIKDNVTICLHAKRDHKLYSIYCGPMRVVESKTGLGFVVEDIINARTHRVHVQRALPYTTIEQKAHASE